MEKLLVQAVSKTIRQLRVMKKLSQEELGSRSGLDRTYISGVERGIRNISLRSLESIVNGIDVPVTAFLDRVRQNCASEDSEGREHEH